MTLKGGLEDPREALIALERELCASGETLPATKDAGKMNNPERRDCLAGMNAKVHSSARGCERV